MDSGKIAILTNYDYLGRVTQRGNGSLTISYTYGASGNGQMSLISESNSTWTKSYTYDNLGRVTGETMSKGNTFSRRRGYTYGSNGLLATDTMPGNKAIHKYTFDPIRGNLTQKAGYFDYSPYTYTYDNADRLRMVSDALGTRMSVTYSDNGNIKSKTGIGNYNYGISSQPHAVTAVENANEIIGYNTQDIGYNNWGKVSSVWQTDENDFYYYFIDYGPDMKRVTSELDKTYNVQYEKYYWDDYEEKTSNGVTTRYWYVYGPDGLIGLYTEKDVQNSTVSKAAVAITDHLGTILSLCDNSDPIYVAEYDEWGRRIVDQYYTPGFDVDRGYTGHEHIEELGLINMNGRMYDYNLGRFLSPDDYIQSPSNPQNYNRYSYCLNNPLKYTDSDGEFWEEIFFDPITFGLGNLLVHRLRGDIKSIGDGFKFFGQGFLTGAALSVTWSLAPCIPIVGDAFQAYMLGNAFISTGMMALGITSGWKRGFYTGDWSTFTNSLELMLGNYYIDENAGFWEGIGQGYSRHTWESLQTTIGHGYSQIRNLVWNNVDRVDFMAGATYATTEQSGKGNGVTLSNYININIKGNIDKDFDDWVISNPLYMHEYGHTIDSRGYGPSYLFTIGWSSLNSARTSRDVAGRSNHKWFWTELRANNNASRYFQDYYSVDWADYTDFEIGSYYPLVAPKLTKQ